MKHLKMTVTLQNKQRKWDNNLEITFHISSEKQTLCVIRSHQTIHVTIKIINTISGLPSIAQF